MPEYVRLPSFVQNSGLRLLSPRKSPRKSPTGAWPELPGGLVNYWCGRKDLNLHALASASPSSWCVCQFRHFRERNALQKLYIARHGLSSFPSPPSARAATPTTVAAAPRRRSTGRRRTRSPVRRAPGASRRRTTDTRRSTAARILSRSAQPCAGGSGRARRLTWAAAPGSPEPAPPERKPDP